MLIAAVAELPNGLVEELSKYAHVHLLDCGFKMPFENAYETPETLGLDRLALVAAATQQFPNKDTLIIDAGTCITYDFVTAKAQYQVVLFRQDYKCGTKPCTTIPPNFRYWNHRH